MIMISFYDKTTLLLWKNFPIVKMSDCHFFAVIIDYFSLIHSKNND